MSSAQRLHDDLGLGDDAAAVLLVDSLTEQEAERLHTLVSSALAADAADVRTGVDGVLGALPPVVRARVRKSLQRDDH